jgi:hypothetical protein
MFLLVLSSLARGPISVGVVVGLVESMQERRIRGGRSEVGS